MNQPGGTRESHLLERRPRLIEASNKQWEGMGSNLREAAGAVQSVYMESHGQFDIAAVPCWRQRAVERSPKRLVWAGSLSVLVGTLQLVV